MNRPDRTILVPASSQRVPYRIDEVEPGARYLRIRQAGPDALVIVPPGTDAKAHREFVESSLRASARSVVPDRSKDGILAALLLLVPALLMAGLFVSLDAPGELFFGLSGLMQAVFIGGILLYLGVVLTPRIGVAASLFSIPYPGRPERLLRQVSREAGVRFLTEDVLRRPGHEALHRAVMKDPDSVPDEVWATLWIIADEPELYAVALAHLDEQAREFRSERIAETAEVFRAKHAVICEDLAAGAADPADPEAEDLIERRIANCISPSPTPAG